MRIDQGVLVAHLYSSILLWILTSKYFYYLFSVSFFFFKMWIFGSRCAPRYLTRLSRGISMLCIMIIDNVLLLNINAIDDSFPVLVIICAKPLACIGKSLAAKVIVSSAYVPFGTWSVKGISVVFWPYKVGLKTLSCETASWIQLVLQMFWHDRSHRQGMTWISKRRSSFSFCTTCHYPTLGCMSR